MKGCMLFVLTAPQIQLEPALTNLVANWRQTGYPVPLEVWQAALPHRRIARVDGRCHDLWWEFALKHSFRWQGHVAGLSPAECASRTLELAQRFRLMGLLDQRVEDLTCAERARADLAAALLARPDLLIWEEPFALLSLVERRRVAEAVKDLVLNQGLTVVAASQSPEGLAGIGPLTRSEQRALS